MNLIICCTPLQVLIAEKIMEQYPNQSFFGVMLHTVENAKFQFYTERLSAKTAQIFVMKIHNDRINLLKEILKIKHFFRGKHFNQVFLANFNELHIQFLLSSVKFSQLNTFDDGTANIVKNSPLLKNDPTHFIRRVINIILGNQYTSDKIRKIIKTHYTLYPNQPNITKNTVEINLGFMNNNEVNSDNVINILLGQPIYSNNEENVKLANKVIKKFNIDYYFPHPREIYNIQNIKYINTHLIIEDYISQQFNHKKCRIYTYFSSAILNLMNHKNVEVIALRINTEQLDFIDCYDLFKQVGIQVIDIRE